MYSRRSFLGMAVAGVVGSLVPGVADADERSKLEEEIRDIEGALKRFDDIIKKVRETLEPSEDVHNKITAKYGSFDDWKLALRPDYELDLSWRKSRLSRIKKDENFSKAVGEIFVLASALKQYSIHRSIETGKHLSFPKLDEIVKAKSRLGSIVHRPTGIDLVFNLAGLSESELRVLSMRTYGFDLRDVDARVKKEAGVWLEEQKTLDKSRELLDGVLRKLVSGYPDVWCNFRVAPKEEVTARGKDILAYHSEAKDEIVTYLPKPLWQVVSDLAHEAGHVVCPLTFRDSCDQLAESKKKADKIYDVKKSYSSLRNHIKEYLRNPTGDNLENIRFARIVCAISRMETLALAFPSFKFFEEESGLEEATSYLFQKIVMCELLKGSPCADAVLDLLEAQNGAVGEKYKGAYLLAETLAREKGLVAAFRELRSCSREQAKVYEDRISQDSPSLFEPVKSNNLFRVLDLSEKSDALYKSLKPEMVPELERKLVAALEVYEKYVPLN